MLHRDQHMKTLRTSKLAHGYTRPLWFRIALSIYPWNCCNTNLHPLSWLRFAICLQYIGCNYKDMCRFSRRSHFSIWTILFLEQFCFLNINRAELLVCIWDTIHKPNTNKRYDKGRWIVGWSNSFAFLTTHITLSDYYQRSLHVFAQPISIWYFYLHMRKLMAQSSNSILTKVHVH